VTPQEFERVQRILTRRSVSSRRKRSHPFTGIMRCAYCGQQITGETKRLRSGGPWENYRCSNSYGRCTPRGISLAKVEGIIGRAMDQVALMPEAAEIGYEEIRKHLDAMAHNADAALAQQEAARTACKARLDRLTDMWLSGLISDRDRYRELEAKEQGVLNNLTVAAEKARTELSHMRENADRARNYASFCKEMFAVAPDVQKRAVAKALGTTFLFYGREKRIHISADPLLLEFATFSRSISSPLEPPDLRLQSQKEAPRVGALPSGRAERTSLESAHGSDGPAEGRPVPASLLDALRGPLIPDFGRGGPEGGDGLAL